jgi:hypothetical protein
MFKFLNKNLIVQIVILAGLIICSAVNIFGNIKMTLPSGTDPLYRLLFSLLSNYPAMLRLVVIVLLTLQIVMLQFFFKKNNFSDTITLFPTIWYLAFLVAGNFLQEISPLFFVNFFVILLLNLNVNYDSASIKNSVFLSGIIIGISFFIDVTSLLLLFFVIFSLTVNRFSKGKDIFIAIFGFFIPIIYFLSYGFMTDNFYVIIPSFQNFHFFGIATFFTEWNYWDLIFVILFFFILFYSVVVLKLYFSNKLIVMRKRLVTINILTVVLFLALVLSGNHYPNLILFMVIPVSIYFPLIQDNKQRWIFNDIILLLLLISLWL